MTIELILSLIAIVISILGLIISLSKLLIVIYESYRRWLDRKILLDNFSLGPYDKYIIEQSTKYYIRPDCSNIDPAQEMEIRHALIATREDLFEKIDEFLERNLSQKHLILLADSGMGKTSFLLNYYSYNERKSRREKHNISLVYLGRDNADTLIKEIPNKKDKVFFLDAYDEDPIAFSNQHERLKNITNLCADAKKIIVTCRTQFFSKDEEIPIETGIIKLGPTHLGDKGEYHFWKLYMSPFDDDKVKKYLKKRYRFWEYEKRGKAFEVVNKIPFLSVRPMLLAYIPDIINTGVEIIYISQLYSILVDAWLERESMYIDKNKLLEFSENLAVNVFI
ncbi:MAG: hypothetical protein PVF83_04075, partial [Anaerolineales bacterium]